MNADFTNRCKLLVSNRSRALAIGQTLCLLAVAAIFFVAPFVALAGCGNKNKNNNGGNQQAILKTFRAVAAVSQVIPGAAPNALNPTLMPKDVVSVDSMTLHPVTDADLVPGHWITIAQQGKNGLTEGVQASIFSVSQVKGQKVVELWVAELPGDGSNPLNLQIGQKFLNVSASSLLGTGN
jgi:hypothetical protein